VEVVYVFNDVISCHDIAPIVVNLKDLEIVVKIRHRHRRLFRNRLEGAQRRTPLEVVFLLVCDEGT
jgi:hypothetical protein